MSWIKNLLGIKPSQDEFAGIATKALVEFGEQRRISYDKENYTLHVHETDNTINTSWYLGNAYSDYCNSTQQERKGVLKAYLVKPPEIPSNLKDAIAYIMPRVQTRSFFEELKLREQLGQMPTPKSEDTLVLPIDVMAHHFATALIFDSADHVAYISSGSLKDWAETFETLLPRAITNLTRVSPEPFQPAAPGVYVSHYRDTHDASRILLMHRVKECRVKGRPVAVIANRNSLIITGEDDINGHNIMLKLVNEALKEPRPMPIFPLVLNNDTWEIWNIPKGHPQQKDFEYFNAMALTDVYGAQKELLDNLHEKKDIDLFVATFSATQSPEGEITSYCTWTESVHTILPKAETVVFVRVKDDDAEVVCAVPWAAVQEIMGDSMRETEHYPHRFEVSSFPNENQLNALQKHALN